MGYSTVDPKTKERLYLSNGIFKEILEGLRSFDALANDGSLFHEEYLKIVLQRMVLNAGVRVLFHAHLTDVHAENDRVQSVTVITKEGLLTFSASYFIDATGDADLCAFAGFPCRLGRESDALCQPMTLCFRVAQVDLHAFKKSRAQINPLYQQFQKEGKIKNIRENVLLFPNMVDGVIHFNSTRIVKKNPTSAFEKTEAELLACEQVLELFTFLKENIDGFQSSILLSSGMEIGVRESRMIEGEYSLTQEDLIACTKFDDRVICGNYDIDIHNPKESGTSHYYFKDGTYYTIPYRSLCPKGSKNLLAAGRCISSTHEAQASYRIMPFCCCLGEAAGAAAALCHASGCDVMEIDRGALHDDLIRRELIFD